MEQAGASVEETVKELPGLWQIPFGGQTKPQTQTGLNLEWLGAAAAATALTATWP